MDDITICYCKVWLRSCNDNCYMISDLLTSYPLYWNQSQSGSLDYHLSIGLDLLHFNYGIFRTVNHLSSLNSNLADSLNQSSLILDLIPFILFC